MGDIANVNRRTIQGVNGQVIQLFYGRRGTVRFHLVFELGNLGGARRQDQVLGGDGIDDIGGRQTFGLERLQIEIALYLTLLSPIGIWNTGAIDGDKLGADEVQAVIVELLLRQSFA